MRKHCNFCGCEQEYQEYTLGGHAVLWENSHAVLWENSHAVLRGNSHAELRENSHAELWGNSHAELWENSHAELRENSHAELRGNSHAVLWENSHAECNSPHACGILKSSTASCVGRCIGEKPIPPREYLKACGITIKNQCAILFKSVQTNFSSCYNTQVRYEIGKETVAPDWKNDSTIECGKGLHMSPTIQQAMTFNSGGIYLACRVKLSDMASLPAFAQYPDKIRVRACVPLYQVNEKGEKIEAGPNK